MMENDLEQKIAALLEETQSAHGVYETESLGGYDERWPEWYAAYLLDHGLRDLLPGIAGGESKDLAARLDALNSAFRQGKPGGDWPIFYAKQLAAAEREIAPSSM
jgi:hypothetical protein